MGIYNNMVWKIISPCLIIVILNFYVVSSQIFEFDSIEADRASSAGYLPIRQKRGVLRRAYLSGPDSEELNPDHQAPFFVVQGGKEGVLDSVLQKINLLRLIAVMVGVKSPKRVAEEVSDSFHQVTLKVKTLMLKD